MIKDGTELVVDGLEINRRIGFALLVLVVQHLVLPGDDLLGGDVAHLQPAEIGQQLSTDDVVLGIRTFLLLHQERTIRAAQQAGCTGNHLKTVSRRLLSGMMDDQDADAISVSKLFQLADHLIVAGIAVAVAHRFPNLLQGMWG